MMVAADAVAAVDAMADVMVAGVANAADAAAVAVTAKRPPTRPPAHR